jgi:hypothetical protein
LTGTVPLGVVCEIRTPEMSAVSLNPPVVPTTEPVLAEVPVPPVDVWPEVLEPQPAIAVVTIAAAAASLAADARGRSGCVNGDGVMVC